jgi:hypothetical protein
MFKGARPLMEAVQAAIQTSGQWIGSLLPNPAVKSLVVDGIWSGVGSVVVFLPQILLLFLFIGVLEDSGLPGARGADRGPHHGALRSAREEFHPATFRVCVRRAGDHGDAHHRE